MGDQLEKGSKDLNPYKDLNAPSQKVTNKLDAKHFRKLPQPPMASAEVRTSSKLIPERSPQKATPGGKFCDYCQKPGHLVKDCFLKRVA